MPTKKKPKSKVKPAVKAVQRTVKRAARILRRAAKDAVKKTSARKSSRAPAAKQAPTPNLNGWITHTELASSNPDATKAWCAKVLGWTFKPSVPMPGGAYHLFAYSNMGGGGIRPNNPPEVPGSVPYVNVPNVQAAFKAALGAGAEEMFPPTTIMDGITIAIVRAPGGVPIGFAAGS